MRSRASIRSNRNASFEEPIINLTPLIDVVFVILIMFIVIAPMLDYEGIELADTGGQNLPSTHSVSSASPITIQVGQDNLIRLNGFTIHSDVLAVQLKQLHLDHPNAVPQLFHDRRAAFGTYQKIKNAVEAAGFPSMDLVLSPP